MPTLKDSPISALPLIETTTPTLPSSGNQKLFIRSSDGKLCKVDSAGNVTVLEVAGGAPSDGKYVVSEANGSLSAEIVIPQIASHPDIRVAATNDDEFDTTDVSDPMTGWTTLGTPTSHNINSSFLSHYYVSKAAAASVSCVGIYKAVPTIPFTVTARISGCASNANYNMGGLFIGEATPGKLDIIECIYTTYGYRLQAEQFTTPTGAATIFFTASTGPLAAPPVYFRINVVSSTNVNYLVSPDGYIFSTIAAARNPGFTVGSVGLTISSTNATYAASMAVDWIRFT